MRPPDLSLSLGYLANKATRLALVSALSGCGEAQTPPDLQTCPPLEDSLLESPEALEGSVEEVVFQRILPKDSGSYQEPTEEEKTALFKALQGFQEQGREAAQALFEAQGYEIVDLYREGEHYLIFQEAKVNEEGYNARGWPTLIHHPQAPAPHLVLSVPHPLHDGYTYELGFKAFGELGAGYLLISGTHRYANGEEGTADPVHSPGIFLTMAEALSDHYMMELHAFDEEKHTDLRGVHTVLSSGSKTETTAFQRELAEGLEGQGFNVVLCGEKGAELCGTQNLVGNRMKEGQWVHVEWNKRILRNPEEELCEANLDRILGGLQGIF